MGNIKTWSEPTSWDEMVRRAAGRRHYNSVRQLRALVRRQEVAKLIWRYDSIFQRGIQTTTAAQLGVHRSTVCRDVKAMLEELNWGYCPLCGTWAHKPL